MAFYRVEVAGGITYTAGNGITINNDTISLKTATTQEIGGIKPDNTTVKINSNGVLVPLEENKITIEPSEGVNVGDVEHLGYTLTHNVSYSSVTASSSDSTVATVTVTSPGETDYNGYINITGVGSGTCTITVNVPADGDYMAATGTLSVTVTAIHIYGAQWDGSSSSAWTRTDDAASFADPNPYYAGMSGSPSSPFDNLMPWSGMVRVTDAEAGELVAIPKFWYKWTRSGTNNVVMKLQISNGEQTGEGWHVSPAHADRGDGNGERDIVYIGRYHCSNSDYKSTTGVAVKYSITRATARTNISNLGSAVWQMDFAMWWTVNMLYLIEFADWNSQAKIGYGCGNSSSRQNTGSSDTMPYHTGTMQSSRTTYGVGCQYRYIEDWWGNVRDWVDGIYSTGYGPMYCIKNPASFSDSTGGTEVGTRTTRGGWTTGWTNPSAAGFEYALYPNNVNVNLDGSTYICDYCDYYSSGVVMNAGGNYNQNQYNGAFCLDGYYKASYSSGDIGCRLQKLP